MDLLNLSAFSVGNSLTSTADTVPLAGETGDLTQEFSQMLHLVHQSKLSHSNEAKINSAGRIATDGDGIEADRQPLKNLIDFMDAVESQLDQGNDKTLNALPGPEVINAFSDFLGFLQALRHHINGSDDADALKTDNRSTAVSDQSMEQTEANNLIEFEQVLNDLSALIGKNGSVRNASGAIEIDRDILPTERTADKLVTGEPIVFATREYPSGTLTPRSVGDLKVPIHAEKLHSEIKTARKTEIAPRTPHIPVSPEEIEPDLRVEQTSKALKSSGETAPTASRFLLEASRSDESPSDWTNVDKLVQRVEVTRKPNLREALATLYELVVELRKKKPDQPLSLTQTEQAKLAESTQILRSINFKDMMSAADFALQTHDNFAFDNHTTSGATSAHVMGSNALEVLAQSVLAESEYKSPQSAPGMGRTDFVAFPPAFPENVATFNGEMQDISDDIAQLAASVNYSETDLKDILVGVPNVGQSSENDDLVGFSRDANRVGLGFGAGASIKDDEARNLAELKLAQQTSHLETTLPIQLAEGDEKPASSATLVKWDVASTTKVSAHRPIPHVVNVAKEGETSQSETVYNDAELKDGFEVIKSVSQATAGQSDSSISKVTQSAQQNGKKLQDISVNGGQPERSSNRPLKYEQSIMPTSKADLEDTGLAQAKGEAKGNDVGLQPAVNSRWSHWDQVEVKPQSSLPKVEQVEAKPQFLTPNLKRVEANPQSLLPKGDYLEGSSQSVDKSQNDAQKYNLETASPKIMLGRGAESLPDPKETKIEKEINNPMAAVKEANAKKVALAEKPIDAETDKNFFSLPQPRLKQMPLHQDTPSKAQTVTDFSARAADAFLSQMQKETRQKSIGLASAVPFYTLNVEANMLQQTAPIIPNHNTGAQTQSGSDRVEKWIDAQLDLTSRGWVNNLSKTMVSAINRGQQRLMLTLSPPSLGRINIVFNAKSSGLDLRIHAERKATLSLLGDAEARLVSNLENAGHKVNNLSYAEMNSSANNFDFSNNQGAKGGKDDTDQLDRSEHENVSDATKVARNKSDAKNIDDASLVNITV